MVMFSHIFLLVLLLLLCKGIHLLICVNCWIGFHTHFCGWRELFPGVDCGAVILRSSSKNWHKCNWHGHWNSLFPYLNIAHTYGSHTFIFCCPCAIQVRPLHKKTGRDREVGVWCLWHLHLSSLPPFLPASLSPSFLLSSNEIFSVVFVWADFFSQWPLCVSICSLACEKSLESFCVWEVLETPCEFQKPCSLL